MKKRGKVAKKELDVNAFNTTNFKLSNVFKLNKRYQGPFFVTKIKHLKYEPLKFTAALEVVTGGRKFYNTEVKRFVMLDRKSVV